MGARDRDKEIKRSTKKLTLSLNTMEPLRSFNLNIMFNLRK